MVYTNLIIDTQCGKSMKDNLYKYHKKKCDICKGKDKKGLNTEAIDQQCKSRIGFGLDYYTIQKWKKSRCPKPMKDALINYLKTD